LIEKNGLEILIIDFGVMGEPAFAPDITRQEVVKAGGGDLATLDDHKGRPYKCGQLATTHGGGLRAPCG